MSYYVAAYDTEAVYPWWDGRQRGFSYTPAHITEFLEGVTAVAEVHLQREAPASFFLVAKMLELAGAQLRAILDHPLFDIQCHTFTHPNLIALRDDKSALRYELADAKRLIEDTFGREVIGLTAPGGYTDGFRGHPTVLEVMWEAGYRYVRSVGKGPKGTLPALLDQPFWYTQDGFPELLETPSHAWHDNILTGQPAQVHWPPLLPWPYPEKMGTNIPRAHRPGYVLFSNKKAACYTQAALSFNPPLLNQMLLLSPLQFSPHRHYTGVQVDKQSIAQVKQKPEDHTRPKIRVPQKSQDRVSSTKTKANNEYRGTTRIHDGAPLVEVEKWIATTAHHRSAIAQQGGAMRPMSRTSGQTYSRCAVVDTSLCHF